MSKIIQVTRTMKTEKDGNSFDHIVKVSEKQATQLATLDDECQAMFWAGYVVQVQATLRRLAAGDKDGKNKYSAKQLIEHSPTLRPVQGKKADPVKKAARVKNDIKTLTDDQLASMGLKRVAS